MLRIAKWTAIAVLPLCGCQTMADPAPPASSSGSTLFADEFNAGTLDRSKWNVEGPAFWVNNEQQAYVDAPETIQMLPEGSVEGADGGVLALKPVFREGYETPTGRTADFISGRIDTSEKFAFTYGTASARIKMPDAVGVWPAFWLLGYGEWPGSGETDIMEYVGEKGWTAVAMHGPGYSGETPLVNRFYFDDGTDVTSWHVYSVDRSPDELVFKVDGRPTYRVTRAMVEHYGKWVYDRPQYVILNFALGGVYPSKVNGIEEPYSGLPQATVSRIQRGDIAMYVDWVRVEKAASE